MTNSVSSNRSEKYNIAAFFSGVGGIELGFEQTNEFRVVYATSQLVCKSGKSIKSFKHSFSGRDIQAVHADHILAKYLQTIMKTPVLI